MKRQMLCALAVLLAIVGTVLGAGPASAAPDQTAGTTASIIRVTPVPANGRVSCYGYYGTFKAGTDVIVVDWATASDECYGIATDRTIWHVWPNSGGWKPLPGNGHADRVYRFVEYVDPSSPVYRYRTVFVHADSNNAAMAGCPDRIVGSRASLPPEQLFQHGKITHWISP